MKSSVSIEGIERGVDSFYPRSFIMTSGKDFVEFQQYYWHVYC